MAYFAPIHHPTKVAHSLTARFLSDTQDDLVIATLSRIEIWGISKDSVTLKQARTLNGTISALTKLRLKDLNRDILFVTTETQHHVTLCWNDEKNEIEPISAMVATPSETLRLNESSNRTYVDFTGKFLAMFLWEGVVSIYRIDDRPRGRRTGEILRELGQERLAELFVKSACFLPSIAGPRLAILYQPNIDQENAELVVYQVTKDEKHMQISSFDRPFREFTHSFQDFHTNILIPVPSESDENNRYHVRRGTSGGSKVCLGGVLAIGERNIEYIDSLGFEILSSYLPEATIFTAWAMIDTRTYVLGDDFGYLHILGLITDGTVVVKIQCQKIPTQVSRASTLSYLAPGILYLGSGFADCQLLRLDHENYQVEVLHPPSSFANNAPILDFSIMDLGNRRPGVGRHSDFASGQARIVTGSGIWGDGSLRSIRSGVSLEVAGVLEDISRVQGLFSLKTADSEKTNLLALGLQNETQLLEVGIDGSIKQVDDSILMALDSSSLLLCEPSPNTVLQVTPYAVTLRIKDGSKDPKNWRAPQSSEITQADANGRYVMIVVDGTLLFSIDLQNELLARSRQFSGSQNLPDQITCMAAPKVGEGWDNIGVLCLWAARTIEFVDCATLETVGSIPWPSTEDSTSVPRDMAFVQIHPKSESPPTMVLALDDGTVYTFTVQPTTLSTSDMVTVVIGVEAGHLHVLPQSDGETNTVLVTSDLSTLIYSDHRSRSLIFSATQLEMASHVVPFDTDAFPDSVAITRKGELWIGNIDRQRRTHVKTLPMKKTVRRLAYVETHRTFVTVNISREIVKNEEIVESTLQMVDEILFEPVGNPYKLTLQGAAVIPESLAILKFDDPEGKPVERIVLGASSSFVDRAGPVGVVMVLGVNENNQIFSLSTYKTPSTVSAVKVQDNLIFVAISNGVRVLRYIESLANKGHLQKVASHGSLLSPSAMDVHEDIIGIADVMKSATFFRLDMSQVGINRLKLIGQHRFPLWPTALARVAPYTWLQADSEGNLIVLDTEKQEKAETDDDKSALSVDYISAVNIGQQVNTIRSLDLESGPGSLLTGQAIMTTAEGGVYLFGLLNSEYRDLLIRLQTTIVPHIQTLGNFSYNDFRAFRHELDTEKEPVSFVDGELVERFLDMSDSMQDMICEEVQCDVGMMRNMLVALRQLH